MNEKDDPGFRHARAFSDQLSVQSTTTTKFISTCSVLIWKKKIANTKF